MLLKVIKYLGIALPLLPNLSQAAPWHATSEDYRNVLTPRGPSASSLFLESSVSTEHNSNFTARSSALMGPSHPLSHIFNFNGFDDDNHGRFVVSQFIEALNLLSAGYRAIKSMSSTSLSPSFRRYFADGDYEKVTNVLLALNRQLGTAVKGWSSDCAPFPGWLPLQIYRNSFGPDDHSCDNNPNLAAFLYKQEADPAATPYGNQFIVVCDRFSTYKVRTRDQIDCSAVGQWATTGETCQTRELVCSSPPSYWRTNCCTGAKSHCRWSVSTLPILPLLRLAFPTLWVLPHLGSAIN